MIPLDLVRKADLSVIGHPVYHSPSFRVKIIYVKRFISITSSEDLHRNGGRFCIISATAWKMRNIYSKVLDAGGVVTRMSVVWLSDHFFGVPLAATAKPAFENIRRNRVYEEVAKQIQQLILTQLHPGDKLPAERELAEMLGVSRSSIRDAMQSLRLMGLVEPRQGAGTVVREISPDVLVNPLADVIAHQRQLVGELLDFRKMIEPPLAARAATHASPEEIAEMEEILQRQDEKLGQGDLAIEEDSEFHYTIAMASGNSVVLKVLDVIMDMLRETRARSLQREGRPQKSLAGHRKILIAIKRHDPAAAEAAMRHHIQDVEKIVFHKL
jgi:GntR family transcriptional repressor for pyruvate dehydrogenase complex